MSSKLIRREEEGIILSETEVKNEIIYVVSVYNTADWKNLEDRINGLVEGREADNIIVGGGGGDFNIRIGELGGVRLEEGGKERRSKDLEASNEGRKLIDWIQEKDVYPQRCNQTRLARRIYICRSQRQHCNRLCICQREGE